MMIAIWALLDSCDLKRLNAPRTLLVSAANIVAVAVFSLTNAVRSPETMIMLVGAMIGGYGGAHVGRRAHPQTVWVVTLVATTCITLAFFLKTVVVNSPRDTRLSFSSATAGATSPLNA